MEIRTNSVSQKELFFPVKFQGYFDERNNATGISNNKFLLPLRFFFFFLSLKRKRAAFRGSKRIRRSLLENTLLPRVKRVQNEQAEIQELALWHAMGNAKNDYSSREEKLYIF